MIVPFVKNPFVQKEPILHWEEVHLMSKFHETYKRGQSLTATPLTSPDDRPDLNGNGMALRNVFQVL